MSLDTRSKTISCDSADCGEKLSVPLSLPSAPASRPAQQASPAAGWVFVSGVYEDRHYCPTCADKLTGSRAA